MYTTDTEHRPLCHTSMDCKEKGERNPFSLRQLVRTNPVLILLLQPEENISIPCSHTFIKPVSFYMNCLVICIEMIPNRRKTIVEKLQDNLSRRNVLTLINYEPGHCSHNFCYSLSPQIADQETSQERDCEL